MSHMHGKNTALLFSLASFVNFEINTLFVDIVTVINHLFMSIECVSILKDVCYSLKLTALKILLIGTRYCGFFSKESPIDIINNSSMESPLPWNVKGIYRNTEEPDTPLWSAQSGKGSR